MGRIFVDSNIFIFASIAEFPEHRTAVATLQAMKTRELFLINAIITFEVHYKLGRLLGWKEATRRTSNILSSPYIAYEPIYLETLRKAITLAARSKIKTNDAIIAQHSIDLGTRRVLTDNAKDFSKVKGLEVVQLR